MNVSRLMGLVAVATTSLSLASGCNDNCCGMSSAPDESYITTTEGCAGGACGGPRVEAAPREMPAEAEPQSGG
jgi:hypothetical protein